MIDNYNQHPDSWAKTTLGEVLFDNGSGIIPQRFPDESFELYSVPSFDMRLPEIVKGKLIGSNKQIVETNTVLLSKINPRINRVWVVGNFSNNRKIASTEWIAFFPIAGLKPAYLCYYLQQIAIRDFLASNVSGVGGSLMRIKASTFASYAFFLAPLPEQHRIVAEIERQFSLLDAGVANLKRVQANLKRYRASVLQAACEGRLVPNEAELAPAAGRPYEAADALLTRILAERRARWETEQLAKMEVQGKLPIGGAWKTKYQEPAAPDTSGLPELPEGWTWTATAQLGKVQLGRQRSPQNRANKYPTKYIRAANITEKGLDLSDVLEMEFTPRELDAYSLQIGDLILSEASGSPRQVGKPAIWNDELKNCCFQNTVIRFRPYLILSSYCWTLFMFLYSTGFFAKVAGGVGINHLGADKFSNIPLPLAPISEQERIVAEVERCFSIIDNLEQVVTANLKRAERLRQSILKEAFAGRLVPQDPTDEPATVLLERIQAEREARRKPAQPLRRKEKPHAANGYHDAPRDTVPSGNAGGKRGTQTKASLQPDLFSANGD